MDENKYDSLEFFNQYKRMSRSVGGLGAAGEWHELQKMMPDFQDQSGGLFLTRSLRICFTSRDNGWFASEGTSPKEGAPSLASSFRSKRLCMI